MSDTVFISTHRMELAGALREAFQSHGYDVDLVPDTSHLDASLEPVLLVVTGEKEKGEVERWVEAAAELAIPALTSLAGPEAAQRSRQAGAEEVFGPDPDVGEVVLLGHRAAQRRKLQSAIGIVGESEAIREVIERMVQIAPVDSTVLITGESGTGKELVARGIHGLSSRRHRGFLAVNVAAVTESLLESELFGHEKGAFTGAIDSRKGFFELADKGTLFLDEIGEMPPPTQTKLLRVLEQREFLRVGGERPIRVDVRIIAATNQDLRQSLEVGRFRRDLYYRLNILGIELPPLRRRREDVPRLVRHFVREVSRSMDRAFPGISEEAMKILVAYDWPGNIRELRNLVESMVVLAPGRVIGPLDIPSEIRAPGRAPSRFLPAVLPGRGAGEGTGAGAGNGGDRGFRPELEFLFRTMVELKVDVDQLRREFEIYRARTGQLDGGRDAVALPGTAGGVEVGSWTGGASSVQGAPVRGEVPAVEADSESDREGGESSVVFRPGMTMDEIEREAIRMVLLENEGNRRKAAESLGIGERTLYRKIRKYEIEE